MQNIKLNADMWEEVIDFYKTLVAKGHDFASQIELVNKIAESKYANEFYPHTSLYYLCISSAKDFEDKLTVPMVSITYLGNQTFKIEYWNRYMESNRLLKQHCHSSQVWSLLESLFLRLSVESNSPKNSDS
jgi:hypothetical protein